ncbi:hypothetical protein ROLI_023760 [Roseobacter fucihabitans]|uniref:Uncharacterized protein n=1 Tax=Roseobacter fucihabitans TaxID=1537242 RepID=A0ABZ2BVC5_9RHOB|nr:hypothetical protein [Roseobacter litoralis]MBC6965787.1 hypothetical protein [Roseobacter litoralis]
MTSALRSFRWPVARFLLVLMVVASAAAAQADISRFLGVYDGSATVTSADGKTHDRDMNVVISHTRNGFRVDWTSTTYRPDGTSKAKSYSVEFVPSDRGDVYAAAMKRNVFGHDVQLDPMKGEPYVWSRIDGDTLSVYSLFVAEDGGYEIQQFNRTLAVGGLNLDYKSVRNGEIQRTVSTFLKKQ